MIEARSRSQLVVVGCSAGGIEALCTLLSTLRAPFPAPIVIAQHLDPRRESHLGDVLRRRSELPVRTVASAAPLEDGVVYIVPPGRDVEITDHELRLQPESSARPKPSVDTLFRTAAEVFGENLIAIVLTGNGSDGTLAPATSRSAAAPSSSRTPTPPSSGACPSRWPRPRWTSWPTSIASEASSASSSRGRTSSRRRTRTSGSSRSSTSCASGAGSTSRNTSRRPSCAGSGAGWRPRTPTPSTTTSATSPSTPRSTSG
ncbi:uncharacterized protein SOCE836_056900 [Sorangium cellulosum]|uniref:protein-glutamate methylesterase n=1 Tax=Sorangium cellulosum TaxID=56 RepID=A0A4P2QTC1_SORCE|nr:uncharacterized protein SOCE836_056900 [Sorangium cellulosum]